MARCRALAVAVITVAALVVPSLIGQLSEASAATYHEWTLSGVTFDDGGTLSGTLVIADDGSPYSEDVTAAGGNTGTFGTFHYVGMPTGLSGDGFSNGWYLWAPGEVGNQYLNLKLPDTTTSSTGDSLPLPGPNTSWECTNCAAIRYVNGGSITEGDLVDLTPPVISPTVTPSSPDGLNGWYVGSPTVHFDVTDPDSDISDQTGCEDQVVDTDTTDASFLCQATSSGGPNSSSVDIKRDATPPTLAPMLSQTVVVRHAPRPTVAANATDATSGIASSSCQPMRTRPEGVHTLTCTATDNAGNTAQSAPLKYLSTYYVTPLTGTPTVRAKRVLRLDATITDIAGKPITHTQYENHLVGGCRLSLVMTGAQKHRLCLTFNSHTHRLIAPRALGAASGKAKIVFSLSYPGSSFKTQRMETVRIQPAR